MDYIPIFLVFSSLCGIGKIWELDDGAVELSNFIIFLHCFPSATLNNPIRTTDFHDP